MKRIVFYIFMNVFISPLFAFTISELIENAFQNNIEVIEAEKKYSEALLSTQSISIDYSPELLLSSNIKPAENYLWNRTVEEMGADISYKQTIPGGTSFSFTGKFYCEVSGEGKFLIQKPEWNIELTQSLLPFWIQGISADPEKEMLKNEMKYYYYRLLYVKKTILQQIIHDYAYAMIYKNQIYIDENMIKLLEKQISVNEGLKNIGASNLTEINQLELSKWTYDEDLISVKSEYLHYINSLKIICGVDFNEKEFENQIALEDLTDELSSSIYDEIRKIDPEKANFQIRIENFKNNQILEKQKASPELMFLIQSSSQISVGINFSPYFKYLINRTGRKTELQNFQLQQEYQTYIEQLRYKQTLYNSLINNYLTQLSNITLLLESRKKEQSDYKKMYDLGFISELEYESKKIQMENCEYSKRINECYIWMYEQIYNLDNVK